MKHRQISSLIPLSMLLATGLVMSACSKTVFVDCPDLSAPEEGAQAFVEMDVTGERIDTRLNGVNAECTLNNDGSVSVDLAIGLKMTRVFYKEKMPGVAQIDLVTVVLDENDVVVRTEPMAYKAGFADYERIDYPIVDYRTTVIEGQRLVVSLLPAL